MIRVFRSVSHVTQTEHDLFICASWYISTCDVTHLKKIYFSKRQMSYKRDDILQKRPMILGSLLIVATPYHLTSAQVQTLMSSELQKKWYSAKETYDIREPATPYYLTCAQVQTLMWYHLRCAQIQTLMWFHLTFAQIQTLMWYHLSCAQVQTLLIWHLL